MKKLTTILLVALYCFIGIADVECKPIVFSSRVDGKPVIFHSRADGKPVIFHADFITDYNRRTTTITYPLSVCVYNNIVYISRGYTGGYVTTYNLALDAQLLNQATLSKAPSGLCVYGDKVYITDYNSSPAIGLVRLDLDLTNQSEIISAGSAQGQLYRGEGIYIKDDVIYVLDRGGTGARLQTFQLDGTWISTLIDSYGSGNGQLNAATGIEIYNNEIYICDRGNARVQVFNMSGTYQRQWGSLGSGEGQFAEPKQAKFHDGYCYVSQEKNGGKIQIFDTIGTFEDSFIPTDSTQTYGLWSYGNELFIASLAGYVGILVYD